jgi:hypothetical protein
VVEWEAPGSVAMAAEADSSEAISIVALGVALELTMPSSSLDLDAAVESCRGTHVRREAGQHCWKLSVISYSLYDYTLYEGSCGRYG